MSEIKVGDTVQLKSGGPIMTVFGVVAAKRKLNQEYGDSKLSPTVDESEIMLAECCWFERGGYGYNNPCSRAFVIECLETVDMTKEDESDD
jgi:uncharacterized protein YodC (DUF2158 family)